MCRSQVFGDYQIELLTERLFGAVTEQGRGGTVPAPDRSCGIFKYHGIGDLFEDCFSQRVFQKLRAGLKLPSSTEICFQSRSVPSQLATPTSRF